ncbi:hypothetical protein PF005_g7675 [Phytophthora fragariae]|uniref:Uncharacterized protein n=1 Tax=Phytophthora fragariae TaxID=53985 RepID=A0A6A3YJ76_9STRA|nr:hypothetical protein PF005_g7675 [Phytophthora fragariae]KAE9240471.1 hypothetical protein PF002_g9746 [Phytophthora fragariae]KAE9313383.1 hypothetical protein PF001_g8777 [Phytophthora fragariae]
MQDGAVSCSPQAALRLCFPLGGRTASSATSAHNICCFFPQSWNSLSNISRWDALDDRGPLELPNESLSAATSTDVLGHEAPSTLRAGDIVEDYVLQHVCGDAHEHHISVILEVSAALAEYPLSFDTGEILPKQG